MKHGFLFWVSLLFVSVVMASFTISSNCYALSYELIKDYVNQTADFYSSNSSYQVIKNLINDNSQVIQFLNNNAANYESICLGRNVRFSWSYRITLANFNSVSTTGNAWSGSGNYIYLAFDSRNNSISIDTQYNFSNASPEAYGISRYMSTNANNYSNLTGMCYENFQNYTGNIGLTYVGKQGYSPLKKLVFNNAIENTAYNESLYTYYYQGDFYSNNRIYLGYVEPNDSYYFEIRLKDSNNNVIKGTCFVALNTTPNNFYNDGSIYINENYEVYAIPRLLNYSNQYQLEITSYYGDGGNNLQEDIDWFIFLPQNAVISGDYIISLGSGDFTEQDNTNTIIGFLNDNSAPSGDLQAILDISGNVLSGDLFKDIKMPKVDGMNRTTLFDLLYAIAGTIGEDGDAYFDFQLHGETPTRVYASQFRTPDGPLKTLISSFLVFFTFYFLLLQIRHALEMLSTANIKGTLEYVDASLDNMFYM